jgi:hypothetical protein
MTTTVVTQAKRHMCQKEEDMSSYTEGQVPQLMERFQSEGFTSEHLTLLGQYKNLGSIKDVLEGRSEIKPIEVDLDTDPFIPEGWSVIEHKKGGKWKYDSTKVGLYLSKKQQDGGVIGGQDLRKELESQSVMNANLLNFYLKNQRIIPSEWKGKAVFFWGTIYKSIGGGLYVRYLYWSSDSWTWNYGCFDEDWDNDDPSVVLKK